MAWRREYSRDARRARVHVTGGLAIDRNRTCTACRRAPDAIGSGLHGLRTQSAASGTRPSRVRTGVRSCGRRPHTAQARPSPSAVEPVGRASASSSRASCDQDLRAASGSVRISSVGRATRFRIHADRDRRPCNPEPADADRARRACNPEPADADRVCMVCSPGLHAQQPDLQPVQTRGGQRAGRSAGHAHGPVLGPSIVARPRNHGGIGPGRTWSGSCMRPAVRSVK